MRRTALGDAGGEQLGPDRGDRVVANTGMGPIDMTVSGRYLYVQTGAAGTVEGYRINGNGTLTSIGAVPSVVGQEGIASN